MYKEDLAVNNLRYLICHKTQPNQKCIENDFHRKNAIEMILL